VDRGKPREESGCVLRIGALGARPRVPSSSGSPVAAACDREGSVGHLCGHNSRWTSCSAAEHVGGVLRRPNFGYEGPRITRTNLIIVLHLSAERLGPNALDQPPPASSPVGCCAALPSGRGLGKRAHSHRILVGRLRLGRKIPFLAHCIWGIDRQSFDPDVIEAS
jgi:hypothetical protein